MRAPVERDDAGVVDHLVEDHHGVGRLEQLHVVVVGARRHRRPAVEAQDAALRERPVLGAFRHHAGERPGERARTLAPLGGPGDLAVGGIDDQRRAPVLRQVAAVVHPELVVGALDVAAEPERLVGAVPAIGVERVGGGRGELGCRLFRRKALQVAQRVRPLQRRERPEVPHALQIRVAPGGPGHLLAAALCGLARRRGGTERDGAGQHEHRASTSECHRFFS